MAPRTGFREAIEKAEREPPECGFRAVWERCMPRCSLPLVSRELKPLLPGASPKTYNLPYFVGFLLSYRRST